MPELLVPTQQDRGQAQSEGRSPATSRRTHAPRNGSAPTEPRRAGPTQSPLAGKLGSVLRGLVILPILVASIALLLTILLPGLFITIVLLLVGISPILFVGLGIVLTEGIELSKDGLKSSGRPETNPGTPSQDITTASMKTCILKS